MPARDVCANDGKGQCPPRDLLRRRGLALQRRQRDGLRPRPALSRRRTSGLARLVQADTLDAMNAQGWGIPDLGVTDDSELGGPASQHGRRRLQAPVAARPSRPGLVSTSPSLMPGALIEPLFITDPYEGTQAASVSGRQVIAGGLAQAIEQYFDAPARERTPKPLAGGSATLGRTARRPGREREPGSHPPRNSFRPWPARSRPSAARRR